MGFMDSIKSGFIRYFYFSNRSSRSEFWWWVLFLFLVGIISFVVNSILFRPAIMVGNDGTMHEIYDGGILGAIIEAAVFIPSIAVTCRRLHDVNKSGWWQLLVFIPVIGWIILLIWYVKGGDAGENRFGTDPLASAA